MYGTFSFLLQCLFKMFVTVHLIEALSIWIWTYKGCTWFCNYIFFVKNAEKTTSGGLILSFLIIEKHYCNKIKTFYNSKWTGLQSTEHSDAFFLSLRDTVKLDFKELLIKEQIDFKELFTDYQLFYTINLLLNKELLLKVS